MSNNTCYIQACVPLCCERDYQDLENNFYVFFRLKNKLLSKTILKKDENNGFGIYFNSWFNSRIPIHKNFSKLKINLY